MALLAATANVQAAPTFYFDGDFSFDSTTGLLTVDAVIDGTEDLTYGSDLIGSSFSLVTQLTSVADNGSTIESTFASDMDGLLDFSIVDSSTSVLAGDVDEFVMLGRTGRDAGILEGFLDATSGVLSSEFLEEASLFALELNLTTVFAANMFDSNFSGDIDGQLVGTPASVPEPGSIFLIALGLLGLATRARLG